MFEIEIHPTPCTLLRYIVGYKVVSQVFLPKEKSLYLFLSSGVLYYTRVIYNRAFAPKKSLPSSDSIVTSMEEVIFLHSTALKSCESTLKHNNSFDRIDWKSYHRH